MAVFCLFSLIFRNSPKQLGMVSQEFMSPELKINESGYETGSVAQSLWRKTSQVSLSR